MTARIPRTAHPQAAWRRLAALGCTVVDAYFATPYGSHPTLDHLAGETVRSLLHRMVTCARTTHAQLSQLQGDPSAPVVGSGFEEVG